MATIKVAYGTDVQMTVTNLNSLANSQTAGWQSARVDNTSDLNDDFIVNIKIDLANTAPANDKAVYVYVIPWFYDGSAWTVGKDGGNATAPSGSEGTYTISTTNNLGQPKVLNYNTADQVVYGHFNITDFLNVCPQGWSLVIINYTGAAIASSGNVVQYVPVTYTVA